MSGHKKAMEVPVFYPTMEDMNRPFEAFIEKHERKIGAVGLAKIVPPPGWSPRPQGTPGYEQDPDITIERCIKQVSSLPQARGWVGSISPHMSAHSRSFLHGLGVSWCGWMGGGWAGG